MKNQIVATLTFSALMLSCSKKSDNSDPGAGLPIVTPPVKAATPAGLKSGLTTASFNPESGIVNLNRLSSDSFVSVLSLSASELKSRFFSNTGPTQILATVLPTFDNLINNANSQSVTMYAQCYSQGSPSFSGDPSLTQFGVKDGKTYIYSASGAERIAAIITPVDGATGAYTVQAWIGLGYSNTSGCSSSWDGCSYGAMALKANSNTKAFEFSVAGMGFGYCGAQLKSDGSNIYATGSTDMGSSCNTVDTLCVAASDASASGTCSSSLQTFELPAMGRKSVVSLASLLNGSPWAASAYPASGANITLNGTASDDIYFGPTSPTEGVGNISNSK